MSQMIDCVNFKLDRAIKGLLLRLHISTQSNICYISLNISLRLSDANSLEFLDD